MSKTVAYIRVSTKEQHLDRQLEEVKALGIEDKYIYEDKQSGKDFDRVGYQYMKKSLEPGDTVVIKELDRLGRNQQELKQEWEYFRNNEINVRVLDMPALNINYEDETIKPIARMISNIIFEVMSSGISRKDARELIKRGKVTVNGITVKRSDTKLSDEDTVCVNGKTIETEEFIYLLLYKPAGAIPFFLYSSGISFITLSSVSSVVETYPAGL